MSFFGVSNYAHFFLYIYILLFYDDLFDRILNKTVLEGKFLTVNTEHSETYTPPLKITPYFCCLPLVLDLIRNCLSTFPLLADSYPCSETSQASAHETNI